jgi:NADH-quinone oxidoreductase subunit M
MIGALTVLPCLGALLVIALRHRPQAARAMAMTCAIAALGVTLYLWSRFDAASGRMQFEQFARWAPSIGLSYHTGIDGLGLLLLLLTSVVVLMSLVASWSNRNHGPGYLALVLLLECGLFGTFTALNFLHWFFFWELTLVPAFFLVRQWGGPRRGAASTQFFLYTMVGSVALLIAFLAVFLSTGTFEFLTLAQIGRNGELAGALKQNLHWNAAPLWIFWAAFLGFAVKTPVVPFHTWLPATYTEASSETTMLLTGAMSKMGIYGMLRILLPIFLPQMRQMLTPLLWLAVASIVLPALAAWRQRDLKGIFAYSSINHLGYCVLGICAAASLTGAGQPALEQSAALTGVLLQIFSHGIVAASLFWFVALLERRSGGVRGIDRFGGLRRAVPVFTGLMGIAIFASLGLPGLSGFPAEFLIFKGSFPLAGWATAASLAGLLMTAVFLLGVLQRVFFGPLHPHALVAVDVRHADLTFRERLVLAPVVAIIALLGIYPQAIAGSVANTVTEWTNPPVHAVAPAPLEARR